MNSRVAWSETLQNLTGLGPVPVRNSEYVVDSYYTYRPLNGLEAHPNIQYVIHPGGTSRNGNALAFGLKTAAHFQAIDRTCITGRPTITLLYNS
jgi:porin